MSVSARHFRTGLPTKYMRLTVGFRGLQNAVRPLTLNRHPMSIRLYSSIPPEIETTSVQEKQTPLDTFSESEKKPSPTPSPETSVTDEVKSPSAAPVNETPSIEANENTLADGDGTAFSDGKENSTATTNETSTTDSATVDQKTNVDFDSIPKNAARRFISVRLADRFSSVLFCIFKGKLPVPIVPPSRYEAKIRGYILIYAKDILYGPNLVEVLFSDGHRGLYPYSWLNSHANLTVERKTFSAPFKFREFSSYNPDQDSYPEVEYSEVMSDDAALLRWFDEIYKWGFCFVKGVPVNPESTKALLERIAFIRHTHYGGFWDFTSDLTFKDTAYTTEFLGAHTDNTYFTDPARLQLLHLLSHTDGHGGASLLVDGFKAAAIMRQENPKHCGVLAATKQPYHSSGNEDVCIQPVEQAPVFKIHPELNRLYQIRWNNYDRAAKRNWGLKEQNRWYNAARHFNNIIQRPNVEIWTQLQPGTALIFDNWRMLHGRSEFTGKRRMCGGYINNDDFISRYRLLKYGREKVLENLGNLAFYKGNPALLL
ncbi:hypothetical protein KXV95_005821 [Aspergillus fumigatus]|nr:hypothetical protein KXX47_005016 [Aspergillus fumigatus]KAH1518194.1 hypothetical protein KXX06_001157 [Aspergillus fumigatus]KAH1760569.1 hypothetical protein KXX41_005442 [Aspergillus fumigatus]KAH1859577.1 hypothetical protein KXX55_003060 [Aspergillus fumigatus]KAH2838478.1 hypothetical protein KXW76_005070 [Aspergillus fumigatus]